MPVSRRDADPILQRMIEWRKDPTAEATVKLCETLRAERAPIAREEVAYISTTVARLHRGNLEVLRSLGLLQLARGLIDEARVTFVRIADARGLGRRVNPPGKKVARPGSALIATAPNKPARPPLPPPRPPPRKASRSGRSSDSSPPSR